MGPRGLVTNLTINLAQLAGASWNITDWHGFSEKHEKSFKAFQNLRAALLQSNRL